MAEQQDITAAQGFYGSFIGSLKWILPLIAVIAALVVYLIS